MTTDSLPKVLLNYKPRGHRNIGRPIARWETHSLEVGNRPAVYILEVEEEEQLDFGSSYFHAKNMSCFYFYCSR
jgi:hypothetical protein